VSTIWSSAVAGDEISVDLHLSKQAAFDSIRDAWGVPDAVPDEKMLGFLQREYEVEFSIQEHPLPKQSEVSQ